MVVSVEAKQRVVVLGCTHWGIQNFMLKGLNKILKKKEMKKERKKPTNFNLVTILLCF